MWNGNETMFTPVPVERTMERLAQKHPSNPYWPYRSMERIFRTEEVSEPPFVPYLSLGRTLERWNDLTPLNGYFPKTRNSGAAPARFQRVARAETKAFVQQEGPPSSAAKVSIPSVFQFLGGWRCSSRDTQFVCRGVWKSCFRVRVLTPDYCKLAKIVIPSDL